VEALKSGCKVLTQDNGFQELTLTMSRVVDAKELQKNAKLYPVKITAGALGSGLPKRDLAVSRQHRMIAQSSIVKSMFGTITVLVAAIRLIKLPGIYVESTVESVEYYHLIFKNHEIIFAEGTPTESFLMNSETQKTLSSARWDEFVTLFPEARDQDNFGAPACTIPSRMLQKEVVQRHLKNARTLLSL
jgi:hypothetical protein